MTKLNHHQVDDDMQSAFDTNNIAEYQEKPKSDSNLLMEALVQSLCCFQAIYYISDASSYLSFKMSHCVFWHP